MLRITGNASVISTEFLCHSIKVSCEGKNNGFLEAGTEKQFHMTVLDIFPVVFSDVHYVPIHTHFKLYKIVTNLTKLCLNLTKRQMRTALQDSPHVIKPDGSNSNKTRTFRERGCGARKDVSNVLELFLSQCKLMEKRLVVFGFASCDVRITPRCSWGLQLPLPLL